MKLCLKKAGALLALLGALLPACSAPTAQPKRTVVAWISIDGLRSDFIERLPVDGALRSMTRSGLFSRNLEPAFPSITFPSHVSQATGAAVTVHGVPNNSFYDAATRVTHKYPWDSRLLECEPIWITAQRQHARTAVVDWPLSHAQSGTIRSAYFGEKFVANVTDEQRLERLLTIYQEDANPEPLRLLMGYIAGPDKAGHRYGPDAPELDQALLAADHLLGTFVTRLRLIWEKKMKPGDQLFVVVTTDHGMVRLQKHFNLQRLLADLTAGLPIEIVDGGPVADIHLHQIKDETERGAAETEIISRLAPLEFVRTYRRQDLPDRWHYNHPTRTGDLVLVLREGYFFDSKAPEILADPTDALQGMHGYPVEESPGMMGAFLLSRHPSPLPAQELERVGWDQLHPTVAKLLGIKPAAAAKGTALAFDAVHR